MTHGWTPGIGDPTAAGWVTVAAYFIAAALAGRARLQRRPDAPWWTIICLVLIGLGINKQLDLQTLVTQIGREQAMLHNWYEKRRIYQKEFIVVLICLAAVSIPGFWWLTRRKSVGLRVAVGGLSILTIFVITRAASFHHMDVLLKTSWVGVRTNVLLELGGIAVVAFGACISIARIGMRRQQRASVKRRRQ